jgi:transcriptional regulator with XRE-family HTH domain
MAVHAKRVEVSDHWVDAGPFRAQLRYLMASGSLTLEDVAALAGISARLADRLLHGRDGRQLRRISPDTARRLIQISNQHVQALRRIMVPAAPARLQLRRLYRAGWDDLAIARRVRGAVPELVDLARGADTCSLLLAVRLTAAARAEDSLRYRNRLGWRGDKDAA